MSTQAGHVSLPVLTETLGQRHSSGDPNKPVRLLRQQLYIEPISSCNLHCRMCYTNVINGPNRRMLEAEPILDFVRRYADLTGAPFSIYWCGTGEVMLHPDFPEMVNRIQADIRGVTHIIQTNGMVKRLGQFRDHRELHYRVSIDGVKQWHEWHRGPKTYDRTVAFCRQALDLGCASMNIRCLLTKDNILLLEEFEADLTLSLGARYTLSFTLPYANPALSEARSSSLLINRNSMEDHRAISFADAQQIFADRYQGRYQLAVDDEVDNYLSLGSSGVHTCCEGMVRIGSLSDPMEKLLEGLEQAEPACRTCKLFPCQ